MAIYRAWNLDRLTHDLHENIVDSLSMLAFDSKPIISSFMGLSGGLLCLGVVYFLKLLGGSMELNLKLDMSAISNYVLQFMFVAGLPTIAFVIKAFFSKAEWKMTDTQSVDGSVSERDGKSKQNSSGIGYSGASDKMSSWNRGRGFNSGNNNGGYNGLPGAHNSTQLRWRQNSAVFSDQGPDVTQQKYKLPMTNPDAFKYRATSMAPFTNEKVPPYTDLPLSRSRSLWSQQGTEVFVPQPVSPPAPTWSENYIQVRVASSRYFYRCSLI
jgi:hypothetical protein